MSNEITLKIQCSIVEFHNILENKGFNIINKYILEDIYFIPKELEIKNMKYKDILDKTVILRNIVEYVNGKQEIKLTKKKKEIDEFGNITNQYKIDCKILNKQDGINILNAIGYKKLMSITEYDTEYEKNELKILVKEIKNGENLIEVETQENVKLNTIEKIKQRIIDLNLPLDQNDFFVKKAEIELAKIL